MRILHTDLGQQYRGGQHQVMLLLKTLRDAGHASTLLCRADSPIAEPAYQAGFAVKLASPRALKLQAAEHDLVHVHDAHSHTWAAIVCPKAFVVSRRVAFPVSRWVWSRWKYMRAARYLAVSNFVAGRLGEAGVPPGKIDVVHDAVEVPASVRPWRAEGGVVALDSVDPQKGRDLVERAAAIHGVNVTFSRNLTKDFEDASVFVYISRSEGFGSAALVSMAMGVPVIASRIEGMTEAVEDGVSGLSVENEPREIAAAIQRVRGDADLAQSLIEGGRRQVENRFSTRVLLNNTLESYRRALAGES